MVLGRLDLVGNGGLVKDGQVVFRKIDAVNGGGRAGRGDVGGESDGVEDEVRDLGPDADDTLTPDDEADFEDFVCCHGVGCGEGARKPGGCWGWDLLKFEMLIWLFSEQEFCDLTTSRFEHPIVIHVR